MRFINWLIYLIFLVVFIQDLRAQTQIPVGLAILNSSMGNDPRNVLFRTIVWPDPNSAAATQMDGTRVGFDQAEISKIIYFDQAFYDSMNGDTRIAVNRGGGQAREVVIPVQFPTVESDQDCGKVENSFNQLKEVEDRFPSTASNLKPFVASLEKIISKYKSGQREVMGTWMTQEEMDAQIAPTPKPAAAMKLSFTTKDNQHFENATVSVGDLGVNVMTDDGGTTVPFDQLPDDLTGFPDDIRKQVEQARSEAKLVKANEVPKTFNNTEEPGAGSAGGDITKPSNSQDGSKQLTQSVGKFVLITLCSLGNSPDQIQNSRNPKGPLCKLAIDNNGDLFGTSSEGGANKAGTIFEIPFKDGNYGSIQVLVSFDGEASPRGGVLLDSQGNLFCTTLNGGNKGIGAVYELPLINGNYGPLICIASCNGNSFKSFTLDTRDEPSYLGWGSAPKCSLILDSNGNLFGTTSRGGGYFTGSNLRGDERGTVFEIQKNGSEFSEPTVVSHFEGRDGSSPSAELAMDSHGNLFGTTEWGGPAECGTVFEIPCANGGYGSKTVLFSFDCLEPRNANGSYLKPSRPNGANPVSGLVIDRNGNVFGTARYGGANSAGTIFEIPFTEGAYSPLQVLWNFSGPNDLKIHSSNGSKPLAGLLLDVDGNLYGTTSEGGTDNYGTVFEVPCVNGVYGPLEVLANFTSTNGTISNGACPSGGLISDSKGNLFGTCEMGGKDNDGTIFELKRANASP